MNISVRSASVYCPRSQRDSAVPAAARSPRPIRGAFLFRPCPSASRYVLDPLAPDQSTSLPSRRSLLMALAVASCRSLVVRSGSSTEGSSLSLAATRRSTDFLSCQTLLLRCRPCRGAPLYDLPALASISGTVLPLQSKADTTAGRTSWHGNMPAGGGAAPLKVLGEACRGQRCSARISSSAWADAAPVFHSGRRCILPVPAPARQRRPRCGLRRRGDRAGAMFSAAGGL